MHPEDEPAAGTDRVREALDFGDEHVRVEISRNAVERRPDGVDALETSGEERAAILRRVLARERVSVRLRVGVEVEADRLPRAEEHRAHREDPAA